MLVSGHAWVDDTDLYIWIPFFRIGGLGVVVWMSVLITGDSTTEACTCGPVFRIGGLSVPMGSHQVVELLHWFTSVRNLPLHVTTGVHGAGIDRSDSFLTLRAGRASPNVWQ